MNGRLPSVTAEELRPLLATELRQYELNTGRCFPIVADALQYPFAHMHSSEVFYALFSIATVQWPNAAPQMWDGADFLAARLLVAYQPVCPLACQDALLLLESGCWNVSDAFVPFYLATQFGVPKTMATAERVAKKVMARGGDGRSGAVAHHLSFSMVSIARGLP
jgi:hypothetical protein